MTKLEDMQWGAIIPAFILSLAASAAFAVAEHQIKALAEADVEINARIFLVEQSHKEDHDTLIEVASDVRWIRKQLEERRKP